MTNISVILVSGGFPSSSVANTAELYNTDGSRICSLPNLLYKQWHHTQTGLTLCGGGDWDSASACQTLSSSGSWEQSHNMPKERGYHSAWSSPQGTVLLGGWDSNYNRLTTTEILLENGDTTPGFNLDYSIR